MHEIGGGKGGVLISVSSGEVFLNVKTLSPKSQASQPQTHNPKPYIPSHNPFKVNPHRGNKQLPAFTPFFLTAAARQTVTAASRVRVLVFRVLGSIGIASSF